MPLAPFSLTLKKHLQRRPVFTLFTGCFEPRKWQGRFVRRYWRQLPRPDRIAGFRGIGKESRPASSRNGKGTRLMTDRAGNLTLPSSTTKTWIAAASCRSDSSERSRPTS